MQLRSDLRDTILIALFQWVCCITLVIKPIVLDVLILSEIQKILNRFGTNLMVKAVAEQTNMLGHEYRYFCIMI